MIGWGRFMRVMGVVIIYISCINVYSLFILMNTYFIYYLVYKGEDLFLKFRYIHYKSSEYNTHAVNITYIGYR